MKNIHSLLNKGHLFLVVVISILLSTTVGEAATTFYVAKTGSNSNSCAQAQSLATPKLTIKAGGSCLSSGDTLLVKSGTYVEYLKNPVPGGQSWAEPTTLAGAPGETVTIKSPTNVSVQMEFNGGAMRYIIVDNVTLDAVDGGFDGGGGTTITGKAFSTSLDKTGTYAHHIRVQNSIIKNSPDGAVLLSGDFNEFKNVAFLNTAYKELAKGPGRYGYAIYMGSSNNLVDGCFFKDTGSHAINIYNETTRNTNNNIIRNSEFVNSGLRHAKPRGAGIIVGSGSGNMIINNILRGGNGGSGLVIYGRATQVLNNTIYNNVGNGISFAYGGEIGTVVRNNIFWQNTAADWNISPDTYSNNLNLDPFFVDAPNGEFQLKAGSPAIDSGWDLSDIFTVDAAGNSRNQGTAFDIGAYEFTGDKVDNEPPASPIGVKIVSQ